MNLNRRKKEGFIKRDGTFVMECPIIILFICQTTIFKHMLVIKFNE